MSYKDSNIGKRQYPTKSYNNFGETETSSKKRDRDTSSSSTIDHKQVSGGNSDPNDGKFSNFPEIPERSVEVLQRQGYKSLFPIQTHCFYPMYQREDLIARDLTGSGKTFAFGLPVVEYLRKNKLFKTGCVQAIMIAPTRELALQITAEINKMKHSVEEFKIVTVYGGVSVMDQANQLKRGVDLFVGTTGRVLDHIERGNISFRGLKTIVLDEADVMLKLGFKEDIEKILLKARAECDHDIQMALFSATVPGWVRDIAREFMKPNFRVVDLAQDLSNKTARNVRHLAIECPWHNRLDALGKILSCYAGQGKVIVFTSTKADANSLLLSNMITHDVEVMHGDIAQNQREVTIKRFKEGKFQVLVATDVASRGLDIPAVDLIVQIEPPKDTESYIHRSGRTARAGKSGVCITMFNQKNEEFVDRIEELAGIRLERTNIPTEEDMIKSRHIDILKRMLDVEQGVLPEFKEAAQSFLEQHHGNAEMALQIALAYASGHYKQATPTKSLLTGRDNMATMLMNIEEPGKVLEQDAAFSILQKYWAPRIADQVKSMRSLRNKSGVVFDVATKDADMFVECFENLKANNGHRVDFEVSRCKSLPDLEQDSGNGGSSGGGGGYGGARGGGAGYGGGRDGGDERRGGGYEGGGRRGGDREDRGGNSGHNGGGGGGNWGQGYNRDIAAPHQDKPLYNFQNKPRKFNDFNKSSLDESAYESTYGGGSTAYSQNHMTPEYKAHDNYKPRYNDFGNRSPQMNEFHQKQSQQSGSTLYFTNLSYSTNEHELMAFLKSNSFNPKRAKLLYDSEGKSKGTGFVQMESEFEAKEAINQLYNQVLEGRNIVVNMATNQEC